MKVPEKIIGLKATPESRYTSYTSDQAKINEIIDYLHTVEARLQNLQGGWTDVEIKKASFAWPQLGDIIYRFNSRGDIIEQPWYDSEKQQACKAFLGIWRTREEAEKQKEWMHENLMP